MNDEALIDYTAMTEEEHLERLRAMNRLKPATHQKSQYGKRGGTSANAGRKAVTYEAVLPGGTVLRKRTFTDYGPTAVIGYFKSKDTWIATGVRAEPQDWPDQTFIAASKVTK